MKTGLAGGIVLVLLICAPVFAAETLTLYDNFNTANAQINPYKWNASSSDQLDTRAYIYFPVAGDGELYLAGRSWGFRTTNALIGEGRGTNTRLRFRRLDPDVIRAVRATVKVLSASATGCPATGTQEITGARFRIGGFFFNDGTGEPGRAMGDVFARLEIRRQSNNTTPNQLDVRANVHRCVDNDCVYVRTMFNQVLGTILAGEAHSVLLQWDNAAHRFIFQLDGNPAATYSYTLKDSLPPLNLWDKKYMGLAHWVPNCIAGVTQAYMAVAVDDVYLNTAATSSLYSPIVGTNAAAAAEAMDEADIVEMETAEP